jgi:hypothetical protein
MDDFDPSMAEEEGILDEGVAADGEAPRAPLKKKNVEDEIFRPVSKPIKAIPRIDASSAPKVWKKRNKSADGVETKPYSIFEPFLVDEAIDHKHFGKGFVTAVLSATKIQVVFEDNVRQLVCNKGR